MSKDKNEILLDILFKLFDRNVNYHDQKEKMIHAGLLLEIGLFIAVITNDQYIKICDCYYSLIYAVFWLVIYCFIRTHSLFKRTTNVYRIAYEKVIWLCLTDPNIIEQDDNKDNENAYKAKWYELFCTFIFPFCYSNRIISYDVTKADSSIKIYPKFFSNILNETKNEIKHFEVGSIWYEIIISFGSFIMLLVGIMKIL